MAGGTIEGVAMRYARVLPMCLLTCAADLEPLQPEIHMEDIAGVWSGRAVAVAANPTDGTHLFVASESGGLFFTTDGGLTFTHVDSLPSFDVVDVAYAPGTSNVVIATAATDYRMSNGPIWRSDDEGVTWTQPASTMPVLDATATWTSPIACGGDFPGGYGVSFAPDTPTAWVGTDCGLFQSTDLGVTWTLEAGVPQDPVFAVLAQGLGRVVCSGEAGIWLRNATGAWLQSTVLLGWDPTLLKWTPSPLSPGIGGRGTVKAFAASPANPSALFYVEGGGDLYVSLDGGARWSVEYDNSKVNRPQFVRSAKTSVPGEFVVYYGDSMDLHMLAYAAADLAALNTTGSSYYRSMSQVNEDHGDPSDLAVDGQGAPLLLVGDGGVHRWDATSTGGWMPPSTTVGGFVGTGAGSGGYNALQIVEVIGQDVGGTAPHRDLYFDTQDNAIHAISSTAEVLHSFCCEGFGLQAWPGVDSDKEAVVTGRHCRGCEDANFAANAHFDPFDEGTPVEQAWRPFPNAWPSGTTVDAAPLLLSPHVYLQQGIDLTAPTTVLMPSLTTFMITLDADPKNGTATWTTAFSLVDEPRGVPVVAGTPTDPVIYIPVVRPGTTPTTGVEDTGLVKVTGHIDATGATFTVDDNCPVGPLQAAGTTCDGDGMGGMGLFYTVPQTYAVLGVDTDDPDHLWYPDVDDLTVKVSVDGGETWTTNDELTALVTGAGGGTRFAIGPETDIHAIRFDPANPCHILVGTGQNGLFRSVDRGDGWAAVVDTEPVGNLSSFWFPPDGDEIYVSSYGSGLWKLGIERGDWCEADIPVPPLHEVATDEPTIIDPATGDHVPFHDLGDPELCPACRLLVVDNGGIAEVKTEGRKVTEVVLVGGTIHEVASRERLVAPSIPNSYAAHVAPRAGPPIRGLVIGRRGVLEGIITSRRELPFQPARVPFLRVRSRDMAGGLPRVKPDGTLTLYGEGFAPRSPVAIVVEDERLDARLSTDQAGRFRTEVRVALPPGTWQVAAFQREGKRLTMERRTFIVLPDDALDDEEERER